MTEKDDERSGCRSYEYYELFNYIKSISSNLVARLSAGKSLLWGSSVSIFVYFAAYIIELNENENRSLPI